MLEDTVFRPSDLIPAVPGVDCLVRRETGAGVTGRTAVVLVPPLEGSHPLTALGPRHSPPGLRRLAQVVPHQVPVVLPLVGTLREVLRPHGNVSTMRDIMLSKGGGGDHLNN